jgi:hypothetical protein
VKSTNRPSCSSCQTPRAIIVVSQFLDPSRQKSDLPRESRRFPGIRAPGSRLGPNRGNRPGLAVGGLEEAVFPGRSVTELEIRYGALLSRSARALFYLRDFAGALHRAAARAPVVLVLDGLDQLDYRGQGLSLAWLPEPLPPAVRLVVSTAEGPVLDELSFRPSVALPLYLLRQDLRKSVQNVLTRALIFSRPRHGDDVGR